ncbi:MAG: type 4a pilus biogenesis protein PilO [Patescibacteria group bacterium]
MPSKDLIKLNLKNKIIVSIITLFLFIISIIYFIVFPAIRDIKSIKEEIEFQRLELEQKYFKGQNLKALSEKLNKIEASIKIFDQIFINQASSLDFITTLEGIAGKNSIIQKINLLSSSEEYEGRYKEVPVQLLTQGDFSNQLKYLTDLEALGYYINIKSIDIKSGSQQVSTTSEGDGRNIVSLLIQANTYWKQ